MKLGGKNRRKQSRVSVGQEEEEKEGEHVLPGAQGVDSWAAAWLLSCLNILQLLFALRDQFYMKGHIVNIHGSPPLSQGHKPQNRTAIQQHLEGQICPHLF